MTASYFPVFLEALGGGKDRVFTDVKPPGGICGGILAPSSVVEQLWKGDLKVEG